MMAEDSFRGFLCEEICQNLEDDDIKKMKFCIRKHPVNSQELERVSEGTDLMEVAMKANLFTESDTSCLETMLNAAGRKDLVEKVKEYKNNLTVLSSSVESPCNLEEHVIGRKYMKTQTSEELETAIKTEDVIILSGVLGSGKTQLAVNYGYEFHKKCPTSAVWMIRSKDQASLQTSMTTLANELGVLKGKDKESENPINKLGEILANALMGKTTTQLIIFDDVNEDCQRIVEDLIEKFVPLEKTQGFIKIIVTTMDDLLQMPRPKRIPVSGFTEEEAVTFLRGNKSCADSETDALKKLASRMSYLPLGLSCASTYMSNCCKSGQAFFKLLNANTLAKLDGKLAQYDASKRGLFGNLNTFIRIMEKDLDKDATEMFQMTQFLENEKIPIILFELLSPSPERYNEDIDGEIQHDDVETCYSLSTDSLVQAVQKFSFGTVQGIDDKRLLNTHTAVSLTLQAFTDEKRKRRLLNRLLWTCALIFDKDNRQHQDDYNRMASVLPHARSVLRHAEDMTGKDIEMCLLMAFVNDLVAYTSNFEGLLGLEKYHSEKALQFCYEVMETTETDINEEVSDKHVLTTYETHREFAKAKAIVIDKKLTGIRLLHERKVENFIRHFIQQKRRTKGDVEFLTKQVENYREDVLTMQQYEALCKKKKAIQLTDLMDQFIKEMILSTFYTYGRRIFYLGKYSEVEQKCKFCHYLFLADEFGDILRNKCPESLPLYSMLAKRNGTLELVLEDIPELELHTVNNLQHTANAFEQLLDDNSCYYVFGIFKMHAPSDNMHRSGCLKQLLRTYLSLLTLSENTQSDKTEIVRKGKEIIKKLENVQIDDAKNNGVWSRVGQFQFAAGDTKAAEKAYKHVCPPSLLEGEVKSRFVSKHELTAAYGLADCYDKEEKKEHAKCILQKLLKMLPDIQNQEKENVRKRICSLDSKS